MSGIAEVLLNEGYQITGSDIQEKCGNFAVGGNGRKNFLQHSADNIAGSKCCCVLVRLPDNWK